MRSAMINSILGSLQQGNPQLVLVTYFDSDIGMKLHEAWMEQWNIGWDQILKGYLSKQWGEGGFRRYTMEGTQLRVDLQNTREKAGWKKW